MTKLARQRKPQLLEYRPRYHLGPPQGGANDVQCLFWRGAYHVFYGLLPTFPLGGAKCWGHASSRDLVHWQHHPPCLEPDPGAAATWTGCLVDNGGTPTAFYTRVYPQAQCLATSADLIRWEKYAGNPVISAPPPELGDLPNFRDPCVWREAGGWRMALGSGLPGKGSAVLLYQSADLIHWQYRHPLFVGPTYDGDMYECPDFFPLGDYYVLLASTVISKVGRTLYFVGTYAEQRFTPLAEGWTDFGPAFYAAKTLVDDRGRRILWGWIPDAWSRDFAFIAGWGGAYSLPRVLALDANQRLCCNPAGELQGLRGRHWHYAGLPLKPGPPKFLPGVRGRELEIVIELDPGQAAEAGLLVCATPPGVVPEEQTRIYYAAAESRLVVDRRKSSEFYPADVPRDVQSMPLKLAPGQALQLRVFLDRSVIEIYDQAGHCFTTRIYPFNPDSQRVGVLAQGGAAELKRLDAWTLQAK